MRLGVIASRSPKKIPLHEDLILLCGYIDAGGKVSTPTWGYILGNVGALTPASYKGVVVDYFNLVTAGGPTGTLGIGFASAPGSQPFSRIEILYGASILLTVFESAATNRGPKSWTWVANNPFSAGLTYTIRIWY